MQRRIPAAGTNYGINPSLGFEQMGLILVRQPFLCQDDRAEDGKCDTLQEDGVNSFAFARTLRSTHHMRAGMHHLKNFALQVFRFRSDLKLPEMGYKPLSSPSLEEAVADLVERIRVFSS